MLRLLSLTAFVFVLQLGAVPLTTLAPMRRPPRIDGEISLEEWRGASCFAGLQWGKQLDPRRGMVWLGMDSGHFYVAFRTSAPPDGKLRSRVQKGGDSVVHDDCVELWFVPPAEGRNPGRWEKGYFQFIVNSKGVVFDRQFDPGYGLAPRAWDAKPKMANRLSDDGFWEVELAFPAEQFGFSRMPLPSTWRINAVRNWKSPWRQANLVASQSFSDAFGMVEVQMRKSVPVVGVLPLGDLCAGKADLRLFADAEVAGNVRVSLHKTLGEEPQHIVIEPNLGKEEDFPILWQEEFVPGKTNSLAVEIHEVASNALLYRRSVSFVSAPEHRWTMPADYLTFDLDFEEGKLAAKTALGKAEPVVIKGAPKLVAEKDGQVLCLKKGDLLNYASLKNVQIPGAVTFRIRLDRDPIRDAKGKLKSTYFWYTNFKPSGYLGIQHSNNGQLLCWMHGFPELKNKGFYNSFRWEKSRWQHIGLNIFADHAELFLDGVKISQTKLERPLRAEELLPWCVGRDAPCSYDDIAMYSRPLSEAEMKQLACGDRPADGRISFFPSKNRFAIEYTSNPESNDELNMFFVLASADEEVCRRRFTVSDWQARGDGIMQLRECFDLPERLGDGRYQAWIEGRKGERFGKREVVVKSYPWEGCKLGMSPKIIAPFTPLEVKGNTVGCILRDHELGDFGLWRQVESLHKKILARPMELTVAKGGKKIQWGAGKREFSRIAPHRVEFRQEQEAGLARVETRCTFDYDGLMKVDLTLHPGWSLDRLHLDIPLKPAFATLFHASGEHIRSNPAGAVPPGVGVVWGSRSIPQPNYDNFIPYIWLGGERRGICWAADWDKGWIHGKDRDAVELVREDGAVLIRCNFINAPLALKQARTISFAVQASPVKPQPEGWQARGFEFGFPGEARYPLLWPASWGGHYGWGSRYPLGGDFSLIDKLFEARTTGVVDNEFKKSWVSRVLGWPDKISANKEPSLSNHVNLAFRVARGLHQRKPVGKLLWYSCACVGCDNLPEIEVYGDEWQFQNRMQCSDSFVDYAVYYADQMMQHGMQGIYVDNSFTCAKFTWPMGEAFFDKKGVLHPSLGIFRTRNLIRRLAVMMAEQEREPFVWIHMTNGNLLPMMAFGQAHLGWEWKYGGNDYQERFTPEYIRAVDSGLQSGTIPVMLGGNTNIKSPEQEERMSRSALALALPHQMFFYGRMNRKFCGKAYKVIYNFLNQGAYVAHPYWDNRERINTSAALLVSLYQRGNRILAVIGNQEEGGEFSVRFNHLDSVASASNCETGAAVSHEGNTLHLSIGRRDVVIVEIVSE